MRVTRAASFDPVARWCCPRPSIASIAHLMSLRSGVRWEQEALHSYSACSGQPRCLCAPAAPLMVVSTCWVPSGRHRETRPPWLRAHDACPLRCSANGVDGRWVHRTETAAASASASAQPALGLLLLAGEGGFTRAAATAMHASAHAMALLHIVEEADRQALQDMQAVAPNGIQVHGFAMNAAARALCPGLNVMQRRARARGHRDVHNFFSLLISSDIITPYVFAVHLLTRSIARDVALHSADPRPAAAAETLARDCGSRPNASPRPGHNARYRSPCNGFCAFDTPLLSWLTPL
eukprot:ctg_1223.g404